MRSCQSRLALLISGQQASAMAGDPLTWQTPEQEQRELDEFLQGLQALWRQSRPLQKSPNRVRADAAAWIPLRPTPISS